MATVLSSDFPLHVETDGDDRRPAVLLLNPLGTTLSFWDPLIDTLTEHYWVIRLDLRGHGRSNGPVGPYVLQDLARDAVAVLDALEVPRAHVVGSSLGSLVAAMLASQYPERVDRLVLAAVGISLGPHYWWRETIDRVTNGGVASIVSHLEDIFFSAAWREAVPDRLESAREMLKQTPDDAFLAGAKAILDADLAEIAPAIRAATLVIGGEDDPVLRHSPAIELRDLIPDSEALSVGGARHRVLLEQPTVLAGIICEFLADPDGR